MSVGNARRFQSLLRSNLWNKKDILVAMTTKKHIYVSEQTRVYLRDVFDNTVAMNQILDMTKETLNNLHSTYLARISVGKFQLMTSSS
jgi:magnesium transporter